MSRSDPHVCLFTDSLEPSGVGEHVLTLAAELRGDYCFSFVCPPSPGGDPLLARAEALGLEAIPWAVNRPDLRRDFARWLRDRNVALFHGHAGIGWEGHDGVYAARDARVPVVLRTEHLPYLITDDGQRRDHWDVIEAVDCLLAVSEDARMSFREAGLPPSKLRAVRNGITLRPVREGATDVRAELGLPADAKIVLTAGRYSEQKGHCYLVEAIPAVRERLPDAHFVWVGSGPLEDDLCACIADKDLNACVHLLGKRGDVPELLAASDLFVLPSLFEGLPLIVLEAMAAGKPVVATNVCGSAETVRDRQTGRLVPPRDPDALAGAILEALTQPDLAAAWGRAGRRLFEREFTAARMARETAALYEDLLRGAAIRMTNTAVAVH